MKSNIYSNKMLIGTSDLQITDENMGVVSGRFIPNENYNEIRKSIWNYNLSSSNSKLEELNGLRINCQLENKVFLYPIGGFLITDLEELANEDLEFEATGNYRHVIEDNFLTNPPKERIFEPWEFITIEQKMSYEDELFLEIGMSAKKVSFGLFKYKNHKLKELRFNAMAKLGDNDDVLFAVNGSKKNEFDYAVIHLTWKGALEENDEYPKIEYFEDFDHFLNYRLYPDKREWEY